MLVLVVGGSPEVPSAEFLRRAAEGCGAVVAADRGFDALRAAGVPCNLYCGDVDTVSEEGARVVAAPAGERGFEVELYDPHKDFTDLSLALRAIRERWGAADLRCTCLSGGRPDHALGVFGRLASWPGGIELVEDGFSGRVLHAGGRWDISGARGRTFSCVPLAPGTVVSERGMRWELERSEVDLLSDLGVSNVVEAASARVECHAGVLACWLFEQVHRA